MLTWQDEIQPSTASTLMGGHHSAATTAGLNFLSPTPDPVTVTATVTPEVAQVGKRVVAADKRIINGQTDVNQLVPFRYDWAWDEFYLKACANHWMPNEINMAADLALWKSKDGLTSDERLIIERNLGFFSTADSLVANNIVLAVYRHITNPECRQYLLRQAFEEAIHTYIEFIHTILIVFKFISFGLDQLGKLAFFSYIYLIECDDFFTNIKSIRKISNKSEVVYCNIETKIDISEFKKNKRDIFI